MTSAKLSSAEPPERGRWNGRRRPARARHGKGEPLLCLRTGRGSSPPDCVPSAYIRYAAGRLTAVGTVGRSRLAVGNLDAAVTVAAPDLRLIIVSSLVRIQAELCDLEAVASRMGGVGFPGIPLCAEELQVATRSSPSSPAQARPPRTPPGACLILGLPPRPGRQLESVEVEGRELREGSPEPVERSPPAAAHGARGRRSPRFVAAVLSSPSPGVGRRRRACRCPARSPSSRLPAARSWRGRRSDISRASGRAGLPRRPVPARAPRAPGCAR